MELIALAIFAWFLFVLGKYYKDFAITFISGILILISGLISFPLSTDTLNFSFSIVSIFLGFYILFRSVIELIMLYLKDWKFKKKKKEDKEEYGAKDKAKARA